MRSGHRARTRGVGIDYKELRQTSSEAARRAVVEYFKRNARYPSAFFIYLEFHVPEPDLQLILPLRI